MTSGKLQGSCRFPDMMAPPQYGAANIFSANDPILKKLDALTE